MSRREHWQWQQKWRSVFAAGVYRRTGKWVADRYDFSAFDPQYMAKFLQGGEAEQEYAQAVADRLVLLYEGASGEDFELRECNRDAKPSIAELKEGRGGTTNIYVFPMDCSWTAVFHHEDWVPTYFTYAEWVCDTPPEESAEDVPPNAD